MTTPNTDSRQTQRGRILARLIEAHGEYVPAPELARIGGLQFQTRIHELKHGLGFEIENKMEREGRKVLSWYRLVSGPSSPVPARPKLSPVVSSEQECGLFGDISPNRYPD